MEGNVVSAARNNVDFLQYMMYLWSSGQLMYALVFKLIFTLQCLRLLLYIIRHNLVLSINRYHCSYRFDNPNLSIYNTSRNSLTQSYLLFNLLERSIC